MFPGVFQVLTHKHKFISLPYEGFSGSTCSWQLLGWMNTQFGWRASPAAFLHAERHLSLESTARRLRVIQVGTGMPLPQRQRVVELDCAYASQRGV